LRRFEVWIDKGMRCEPATAFVEVPDTATDEECDEACREMLDDMIGSYLDTGWRELPKKEG